MAEVNLEQERVKPEADLELEGLLLFPIPTKAPQRALALLLW